MITAGWSRFRAGNGWTGVDRDGQGWTRNCPAAHWARTCDTWSAMKTAATIDVTVPENREINVVLPPEVPTGKAKLLVMVEEQLDRSELPEAKVVSVDGRPRLVLPEGVDVDWDAVSVRRSRDERTKKLLGMG